MEITEQMILAIAPDPGTLDRSKALLNNRHWLESGRHTTVLWGIVKSAGVQTYQVVVDLRGEQARALCTCPVRRTPCKHALALLHRSLKHEEVPAGGDKKALPPDWVQTTLVEIANRKNLATAAPRSEVEEKYLADLRRKNREKRIEQMRDGVEELEQWLLDMLRRGLAALETEPADFWEDISARLVDAKLGGIARRVKNLQNLIGQPDWHEDLLQQIGEIYLLVQSMRKLDELSLPLQQELLNIAGINFKKEELIVFDGVQDTWLLLGQEEGTDDEQLYWRRTWLFGESNRQFGLLLDFAWGTEPFAHDWQVGSILRGEMIYYPSAFPLRILPKKYERVYEPIFLSGNGSFEGFAYEYAEALADNPWLGNYPVYFESVIPVWQGEELVLVDDYSKVLPMELDESTKWRLLAISGGHPIGVFGVWTGQALKPMSATANDRFILLQTAAPLKRKQRWKQW